ncbi:MAG: type II secretion system GspH family protein [Pirellulaceae bacterium]|nr:type II secretion system GspH family protein [Pirellulaceae bacterium]
MKRTVQKTAFTLIEVLIVVVIMAVLAATILPQFSNSTKDAKESTSKFNLRTLRGQVELYRANHDGVLPGNAWAELTSKTDISGSIGTGATHTFGPYLHSIPENPFSGKATVKVITNDPPASSDVTADNEGGWLWNATTGGLWLDHSDYYSL